jgi:hypothetical protein
MEEFFYSNKPIIIGATKVAHQIKICRILLERLIKDNYIPDNYLEERDRKKCKRIIDHADMLQQQDLDLLFKIMNRKIRTWWD